MMKKNGFTLAEVLITLAIIGVVATMTLPSLMSNTQEAQAKTAFKKAINTLTVAAQTNLAQEGFDYSSLRQGIGSIEDYAEDDMSLVRLLGERTAVDFGKSKASEEIVTDAFDATNTVFFRDGSALLLPPEIEVADVAEVQSDGLPLGFTVVLDINGAKAPNMLSNCRGEATGAIDNNSLLAAADAEEVGDDPAAACTKANRVIKDQFLIKLRGNVAQPDGAAANWVNNN